METDKRLKDDLKPKSREAVQLYAPSSGPAAGRPVKTYPVRSAYPVQTAYSVRPASKKRLGIYLHIPFCIRKCLYCDFLSAPCDKEGIEAYVKALCSEIRVQAQFYKEYEVRTLFFGGGTPSLLDGRQIDAIMEQIGRNYTCDLREVSMELNPGTADRSRLSDYRLAGIDRLSIGLQSVHDGELKRLGRIHTWKQFLAVYEWARQTGYTNINVDLMSALPGQSPENWRESLERVTALAPEHISAYSLIVGEGTPFYDRYGEGRRDRLRVWPDLPSEDEDREMYERTGELLAAAGYGRYEISNYAKEGFQCLHNRGYWERTDYAGFGLGAASLRENVRWNNTACLERYISGPNGCQENRQELSEQEQMEEFMFLGLRLSEGITEAHFLECFGKEFHTVYGEAAARLEKEGLLLREGGRIRLTPYGVDVSNYALAQFLF